LCELSDGSQNGAVSERAQITEFKFVSDYFQQSLLRKKGELGLEGSLGWKGDIRDDHSGVLCFE
jgi:hypothetical protein